MSVPVSGNQNFPNQPNIHQNQKVQAPITSKDAGIKKIGEGHLTENRDEIQLNFSTKKAAPIQNKPNQSDTQVKVGDIISKEKASKIWDAEFNGEFKQGEIILVSQSDGNYQCVRYMGYDKKKDIYLYFNGNGEVKISKKPIFHKLKAPSPTVILGKTAYKIKDKIEGDPTPLQRSRSNAVDINDPTKNKNQQSVLFQKSHLNNPSVSQSGKPASIPKTNVGTLKTLFEELIQKSKQCANYIQHDITKDGAFINFKRDVQVGIDSQEKKLIFIKIPSGRYAKIQDPALRNDQLSFQISHALGLNVVPTTKVVSVHDLLPPEEVAYYNSNCVIQNAVSTHNDQFHLKPDMNSKEFKNLNLPQVHKAIIFNMLLGRHDGRAVNTVIDEQMRVMEIDNEYIGLRTTDSWLLDNFKDTTLSPDFVKSFLKFEKKILLDVLADMASQGLDISEDAQKNIIYNFEKIQNFFMANQNKEIRVSDLIAINK
jgi:hypothetical protein